MPAAGLRRGCGQAAARSAVLAIAMEMPFECMSDCRFLTSPGPVAAPGALEIIGDRVIPAVAEM